MIRPKLISAEYSALVIFGRIFCNFRPNILQYSISAENSSRISVRVREPRVWRALRKISRILSQSPFSLYLTVLLRYSLHKTLTKSKSDNNMLFCTPDYVLMRLKKHSIFRSSDGQIRFRSRICFRRHRFTEEGKIHRGCLGVAQIRLMSNRKEYWEDLWKNDQFSLIKLIMSEKWNALLWVKVVWKNKTMHEKCFFSVER